MGIVILAQCQKRYSKPSIVPTVQHNGHILLIILACENVSNKFFTQHLTRKDVVLRDSAPCVILWQCVVGMRPSRRQSEDEPNSLSRASACKSLWALDVCTVDDFILVGTNIQRLA